MSAIRIVVGAAILPVLATVAIPRTTGDEPKVGRKPWTGSNFVGSPEPPPKFKVVRAFANLKFNHPVLIRPIPGSNRFVVAEQHGKIYSFEGRRDTTAELLHDFAKEPKLTLTKDANQFDAVYGLAFDPQFETNRFCYVCYTVKNDKKPNLENGSRVSRFKVTNANPPALDPTSEAVIITYLQGGHNGGDLHFGPDGYLYITTGDATDPNPPDKFATGQDVSDLLSSVLRIDVHRNDAGMNYAIPKDNPFIGQSHNGKPSRGEVWAYGFRNPWRMSFDRASGDLWLGDVGWEAWEMVHKIEKGGNYGWSVKEAGQTVNAHHKLGPTPIRPPAIELSHAIAASVTGGNVYRGKKYPELQGKYVFGDWMTRRLWAATFNGADLATLDEITAPAVRIIAFGEDRDGELLLLDYDAGTVHEFVRNEAAGIDPNKFPRTLSASGLYRDTARHLPAEGVRSFEINAKQWQDYATSEYLLALPSTSAASYFESKKQIANDVNWNPIHIHLPKDGVLAKTISMEMERGKPATRRRIETQILHFDGDAIQGYTYAWRDDGSDADLVPADGGEKDLAVKDPIFGGVRPQTWSFASRVQCGQCHNAWAGYLLGFNRDQLHRDVGGRNQLVSLCESGHLKRIGANEKPLPSFSTDDLKSIKSTVDPGDESKPLADRARSYLNANCGHCHRFGGGGSVEFHLNTEADVKNPKLWNAKPTRGNFDLVDAGLLSPGHPERSVLYYRMAKFGSGRMPHLGSEYPDESGLRLVRDWIASLEPGRDRPREITNVAKDKVRDQLRMPGTSIELARALGRGALSTEERKLLETESTRETCGGHTRDLFVGFFPKPNAARTLGTNPRPRAILALAGNATNGKALFASARARCATCHKVDGVGQEIGPDLSKIARTRPREHLLESLLDPSRRIDTHQQSYTVVRLDGQTVTGMLKKRDVKELIVLDATGKSSTIPLADVDSLDASRTSLMPDGLLRDFTPQDAADLLAYLSERK
jgi:putative heme-binding domain-containing protein